MVEKEQYLKGEKGNLEVRAEKLEEGEMFGPSEAHTFLFVGCFGFVGFFCLVVFHLNGENTRVETG